MRLIDADALRDEWLNNGENDFIYDTNSFLESIDAQPTITLPGEWTMTPQNAIKYLKMAREYPVAYTREEQEAYEMAFVALQSICNIKNVD